MIRDLYNEAQLYNLLYPFDDDELAFWKALITVEGNTTASLFLDIGSGSSPLAELLAPDQGISLDPCRDLLATSPTSRRLQADAAALPLRSGSVRGIISRLFGVAYAAAQNPRDRLPFLAAQIRRVLQPDGVVALEIPLTARPRSLQGMEESVEIRPGMMYRFRYFAVELEHEYGSVLDTEINVENAEDQWQLHAPLFVFTPEGALRWAAEAGLRDTCFYASYDLSTATTAPPSDALRGVLCGRAV